MGSLESIVVERMEQSMELEQCSVGMVVGSIVVVDSMVLEHKLLINYLLKLSYSLNPTSSTAAHFELKFFFFLLN